ncbi:copper resistance protein [Salmonella enterica subsp. enterica serovar 4,[5],12:i:-]|nr:copper resistance protein [Salmonella enterica subsp. enterica serovar 4,[5],12:i:-]
MFHTIVSIKNDGHYFCRAGGNRPDGLNEPVTYKPLIYPFKEKLCHVFVS